MWGKGRLAETTQAYLSEFFPKQREGIYKKLLTAKPEEVIELLAKLKATNALEVELERDYKSGVIAQEELELEDSGN